MIKNLIKSTMFLLLGVCLCMIAGNVLERKDWDNWHRQHAELIRDNENMYDVLFSGTSKVLGSISVEELFLEYGISSATIGEPMQATYLSYYTLLDALKKQNPEVVVFDVTSLLYSEQHLRSLIDESEFYHLHYSIDNIFDSKIKLQAVEQAQRLLDLTDENHTMQLDKWNYLIPLYFNHSNWENITADSFSFVEVDKMNDNYMLFGMSEKFSNDAVEGVERTDAAATIPEFNLEFLYKMIDLCEEKDIPMVLISGRVAQPWTWDFYNAVSHIAEEKNLPYLDVNVLGAEMGIDWTLDMADVSHFNVVGAAKWSDYIGAFLKENYDLEDHRGDERYRQFSELEEEYTGVLAAMRTRQKLMSSLDFDQYLKTLSELDLESNAILISVKESAFANLSEYEKEIFSEMRLKDVCVGEDGSSYVAVVDCNGVQEILGEQSGVLKGEFSDGTSYAVVSGGSDSDKNASIKINGENKLADGRGFNFVVYNTSINRTISKVSFDSYAMVNPPRLRSEKKETTITKYEAAPNVWEIFDLETYLAERG